MKKTVLMDEMGYMMVDTEDAEVVERFKEMGWKDGALDTDKIVADATKSGAIVYIQRKFLWKILTWLSRLEVTDLKLEWSNDSPLLITFRRNVTKKCSHELAEGGIIKEKVYTTIAIARKNLDW